MEQPSITLNNGREIPQVGFGVYLIWDHDECKRAVLDALAAGYRHIDTAQLYKNERAVGEAIRESGVPREEIFLTTKIWCTNYGHDKAAAAVDRSLERLQVDYIDLVLLHQRFEDYLGAWKALEEAVDAGKVRSIGISNFDERRAREVLDAARVRPAVNQVECHPYCQRDYLRAFLADNGIAMEVWYPLGHGDKKLLAEPVLGQIAQAHGKSAAQVVLRWHVQKGNIVFPKSTNPAHIADNIDIFDFELTEGEMAQVAALDKGKSYFNWPEWFERIMYKFSDKTPFGERD